MRLVTTTVTVGVAITLIGLGLAFGAPVEKTGGQDPKAAEAPATADTKGEVTAPLEITSTFGATSAPYTLATCPVTGRRFGAKAVTHVSDGCVVRVCCRTCLSRFRASEPSMLARAKRLLSRQQEDLYPLTTCVVSGEPLVDEDGKPSYEEAVLGNRLIRACCETCVAKVRKDPAGYIAKLDQAVHAEQSAEYPLETCAVSGEKLGSMGEPVNVVLANRLVRLCCKSCVTKAAESAPAIIAKVDEAWKARAAEAEADSESSEGQGQDDGTGK